MKAASQLRRSRSSIVILAILPTALPACAPLAQVREVDPKFHAQPTMSPQLQQAERAIAAGQQLQRSDRDRAAGFYLAALEARGGHSGRPFSRSPM